MKKNLIFFIAIILAEQSFGQVEFIHTREGRSILPRRQLIANCLKTLHKDKTDQTALSICECQTDKFDGYFSSKQYKKHTSKGIINFQNRNLEKDIVGPSSDTIKILNLDGMTYVKVKIGNTTQFWLFDTGASDLLINKDMEKDLKSENIITDANYLGIGEYEMANGMIDTCRRYKINNIQIGKFTLNNIIVAVTDKGKRIIVGKGLLNKFSNCVLSNRDNTLILTK